MKQTEKTKKRGEINKKKPTNTNNKINEKTNETNKIQEEQKRFINNFEPKTNIKTRSDQKSQTKEGIHRIYRRNWM